MYTREELIERVVSKLDKEKAKKLKDSLQLVRDSLPHYPVSRGSAVSGVGRLAGSIGERKGSIYARKLNKKITNWRK